MGILAADAQMIEALKLPQGFSVCELGNQFYRANGQVTLAEAWYRSIGCGKYVSIDGNDRGSVSADLNYPLQRDYLGLGEFDLVTDFGTGEHIFNQAQVWQTIHDLTKVGGYIAFHRPRSGWPEHGFYNIHATLISDLAAANEYGCIHVASRSVGDKGELIYGVMQKLQAGPFRFPNQGKYKAVLKLDEKPVEHQVVPVAWLDAAQRRSPPPKRIKRWDVLRELAQQNDWLYGAEIGVLNGATFFHLLDHCPKLNMAAVDNWGADVPHYGDLTKVGEEFRQRAATYGRRATVLMGRSTEMALGVKDRCLDFVFIDADHEYASVAADIKAWAPKVRPGGMIAGHDWDWPGVAAAVKEAFQGRTIYQSDDDVWLVEAQ